MLTAGAQLGPYEIVAPLGAGGMGEVYRARDARLNRTVAVKVMAEARAGDALRRRRFEQEARAASALNHPNILTVHDFGVHDGAPYLVTELLEGESLAERLRQGPLPLRKALEVAAQAATGIAAAHEQGIVHRDLKPANLFLTRDGRLKILDFGLAKLTTPAADADSPTLASPASAATGDGVVLGTVGYMAPEQVRGLPADARSDIFALGAILYEMLAGRRAFARSSAADTMAAILKEDPPELDAAAQRWPPAVERILRHCLEKNPAERFQSARDLAFALHAAAEPTSSTRVAAALPGRRGWLRPAGLACAAVVLAAGGWLWGHRGRAAAPVTPVTYLRITFQEASLFNARFAPESNAIVYSAAGRDNLPQIFVRHPDYPKPQPLGPPDTQLLSVRAGQLAVLTGAHYLHHRWFEGTLAEMPLSGGTPRLLLQNTFDADWSPHGSDLAVIHFSDGHLRLEYPIGHVLTQTTVGYLSDVRVSPDGGRVAFFEHPVGGDDRGTVDIVDRAGHKSVVSPSFETLQGLAWSPDGRDLWFASGSQIFRLRLPGNTPQVMLSTSDMFYLFDRDREGDLLADSQMEGMALMAALPGQTMEQDLTWYDHTTEPRFAADGRSMIFTDASLEAGSDYTILYQRLDGSPAVRIGSGDGLALSPDGTLAVGMLHGPPPHLVLYPTGAGESRALDPGGLQSISSVSFFPDGRLLVCGQSPGHRRCYTQSLTGGPPAPLTPDGSDDGMVSPDGRSILAWAPTARSVYQIFPAAGGAGQALPGLAAGDDPMQWTADSRGFLFSQGALPARISRLDLASGKVTYVRDLAPANRQGALRVSYPQFAPGLKSYAYSYSYSRGTLSVIEGVPH
ncbi:MAG TPA: protein kinase [Terriglobales bacterium]|nr:protein kinase [Terriglobales bacterium]